MTRRLLLDLSSLAYRAYFALPTTITDGRGRPVNAAHGYLDMTANLVRSRSPDEVIHCLDDDWRPTPRVEAYDGYKVTRRPEPEDLTPQFAVLRKVIAAAGMTEADAVGWEAEDAIGALCARARPQAKDRYEVVTGDRDLVQLVRDPVVRVLLTRRGVSDLEILNEAGVRRRFGVPASRYAEFAILRGDPSDALPGVKGVGEKTARELIKAYPSLEALREDAERDRPRRAALQHSRSLQARIREAADYLDAMADVVPIRTDLQVRLRRGTRDHEALDRLGSRHRLTGPIRRLREALDG